MAIGMVKELISLIIYIMRKFEPFMLRARPVQQMHKISSLLKCLLFMAAAAVFLSLGSASAVERTQQGEEILRSMYYRNMAKLETNSFGLPLFLESLERDDKVQVDVYGIFYYPFHSLVGTLRMPGTWCEIVSLHPNIKACISRDMPSAELLTFYIGRKDYQTPEEARQVVYQFWNIEQQQGYLDIVLSAEAGPFGTRDHRLRFEAMPLDGERTFVHVSYTYGDSAALRLAVKFYFATLGRGKVGFTVIGTDSNGNPVFIDGPRGAIERNAVRYYFAIQSYLDTLHYPEKNRFTMRISSWYDLTTRFRRQLFELDKNDYLTVKTKEHLRQTALQSAAP